jgi:hypothetical protein
LDLLSLTAERLERRTISDLHDAAPAAARAALGLRRETIGTALVSIATGGGDILLNRTIGLGVETQADRATVQAIVARYRDAGVGRYFLHLHPRARPAELRGWIEDAGLVPARAWMKVHRGTDDVPAPHSDLSVREIAPEHAEVFGLIAARCFGLDDSVAALPAGLAGCPGWRLYMSFDGDTPAGTGAMLVDGDSAWFDWGATLPEFRGRGGQRAVLCRRLHDALASGCRHLFTTTGEAVPGDAQHSYRNIERVGFRPVLSRPNFKPPMSP